MSKASSNTTKTPPRDVTNWAAWRDGDDEYRGKVVEMTQWLHSLDYGTVIVYDGVKYHKPEYRFNFWYEDGWTIGCPVEHTVFAEWFARAAEGDQSLITVKGKTRAKRDKNDEDRNSDSGTGADGESARGTGSSEDSE